MDTNHGTVGPVAVLVEDLYFSSIISSAARHLETGIRFVRAGEAIPPDAPFALLDIQISRDWEPLVRDYVSAGGRVIAFGPHTDTALRKRARAAGCSRVLAKSKFVTDIASILTAASTPQSDGGALPEKHGAAR